MDRESQNPRVDHDKDCNVHTTFRTAQRVSGIKKGWHNYDVQTSRSKIIRSSCSKCAVSYKHATKYPRSLSRFNHRNDTLAQSIDSSSGRHINDC